MESTESWEPGTVILKRSGPLIKQQRRSCASKRNTQRAPGKTSLHIEFFFLRKKLKTMCFVNRMCLMKNKLQIKVPCGKSKQFVLISYDGSSHPISTPNVRYII